MVRIEYRDDTLTLGTDGPLLMLCWWDAPTVEQMRVVEKITRRCEEERGQTAYIQFVIAGTPVFESEVREIAERITRDHYAMGIAHCIELRGLKGAATRAFLGGLLLIRGGRGAKPMKVFAAPGAAATWLAPRLAATDSTWTTDRLISMRAGLVDDHERHAA